MSDNLNLFGREYSNVAGFKANNTLDTEQTYIRPQGTKTISQNGTNIDVAQYATVDVAVSGGGGGIIPTGTINITENGTVDVTNYAYASVNVSTPEITISTSGAVSQELEPDTVYHFTSNALTSLTITFGGAATDQYHFDFISPATAVVLTLPSSVVMENAFSVEVNTKYEIDIYNNYGVFAEFIYGGSS